VVRLDREWKLFGLLCVATVSLVMGLKYAFPLFAPFLLGIFFAGLVDPLVGMVEIKLRVKRGVATGATLILLLTLVLAGVTLTIVFTYQETQRLLGLVPDYALRLSRISARWLAWMQLLFPGVNETFTKLYLNPEIFGTIIRSLLLGCFKGLAGFPKTLFTVILGAISAYFFSRDKHIFSGFGFRWLPSSWKSPVIQLKTELSGVLSRIIQVETGLALVTVIIATCCFSCVGIPGAPAYGFLTGILDFIPVVGPGLIFLPVIFTCVLTANYGGGAGTAFSYFLLLIIRQVAQMRLIGDNLNLHPLVNLVVIYLGMKFFGFGGFWLGPALAIFLRSCYRILLKAEGRSDVGWTSRPTFKAEG
jgi:sporulation integral membrane protein YtvI